ncbi:MAG: hypothetical protein QE164_06980 [Candidatus Nezhaarchaeota archaeon]|nr:hypothetical protein [Candidatus Nezhaarchaeota archaeon]
MSGHPRLFQLSMDKRFIIGNIGSGYEKEVEEMGIKDYDKVLLLIEKLDSSKAIHVTAYFQWMYSMEGRRPQFIVLEDGYELLLREGFKDMEPVKLTILKVLK